MRVSKNYYINMIPVSADTYIDHIEACLKRSDKDIDEWVEAYRALEARHAELRKLAEDLCSMLPSVPERCHNCAFMAECHSQCQDWRCWLDDYMTELGV